MTRRNAVAGPDLHASAQREIVFLIYFSLQ